MYTTPGQFITFIAGGHPQEWAWVIILVAVGAWSLHTYYNNGLWRVPGPFLRSISVIPRILSVYQGFSHQDDLLLHRKYGPIVRTAPNQLSIADPNEIKKLYGTGTQFVKSQFYALSEAYDDEGLIPDTFILNDAKLHSRMKRNASNAYAMHGLVQMEPWIEPVTERFLGILEGYATRKEPVPMDRLLKNYTMDAVFALTFGRDFNYMRNGDVLKLHKIQQVMGSYMAIFGQIPWVDRFLLKQQFIAKRFMPVDLDAEILTLVNEELARGREKMDENKNSSTFLQRLLMNQRQHPEQLNDREIVTHALGNITAGSDTTAIALQSVILNLVKSPRVYKTLCEEVRSSLATLPVQFSQANALPYLNAVVKEAIRIHPSVGMMLVRTVPAGGSELSGFHVPAGTEVGINPWVLHRDPSVFPDPATFYPDRWLNSVSDVEQLKVMNRCFFAFGHGAHTCSGRWISMMEVTKLIPTILLKFDIKLANAGRKHTLQNHWFTLQEGIDITVIPRDFGESGGVERV